MSGSYAIEFGEYRAGISATGAGLRVLERAGRALTETWPEGSKPPLSAGLVLAPWPNRIRDGRYSFGGVDHQLEITEPARSNASHGLVRTRDWMLIEHSSHRVEQSITVGDELGTGSGGEPGWPYPLRLSVVHELTADGLVAVHTATNIGDVDAPFALGVHTFLRAGDAPIDTCTLTLPATITAPLDPVRLLPVGVPVPVAGTDLDFTTPRSLAGVQLDTPFGGLVGTPARAVLTPPDGPPTVLWTDEAFGWVQVFVADPINNQGYPNRGRALAVEPMTGPADALNTGVGRVVLAPGQTWRGSWGIAA